MGSDVVGPMGDDLIPVAEHAERFARDHGGRVLAFDEVDAAVLDALGRQADLGPALSVNLEVNNPLCLIHDEPLRRYLPEVFVVDDSAASLFIVGNENRRRPARIEHPQQPDRRQTALTAPGLPAPVGQDILRLISDRFELGAQLHPKALFCLC